MKKESLAGALWQDHLYLYIMAVLGPILVDICVQRADDCLCASQWDTAGTLAYT